VVLLLELGEKLLLYLTEIFVATETTKHGVDWLVGRVGKKIGLASCPTRFLAWIWAIVVLVAHESLPPFTGKGILVFLLTSVLLGGLAFMSWDFLAKRMATFIQGMFANTGADAA